MPEVLVNAIEYEVSRLRSEGNSTRNIEREIAICHLLSLHILISGVRASSEVERSSCMQGRLEESPVASAIKCMPRDTVASEGLLTSPIPIFLVLKMFLGDD